MTQDLSHSLCPLIRCQLLRFLKILWKTEFARGYDCRCLSSSILLRGFVARQNQRRNLIDQNAGFGILPRCIERPDTSSGGDFALRRSETMLDRGRLENGQKTTQTSSHTSAHSYAHRFSAWRDCDPDADYSATGCRHRIGPPAGSRIAWTGRMPWRA